MEQLSKANSSRAGGVGGGIKNVKIRLMGHCIICLRKVREEMSSELTAEGTDVGCEAALKSEVTSPGFVATFNEIWGFLQSEKDNRTVNISLTTVITQITERSPKSLNVKFSHSPTLCQMCCDKIVAVENLMKGVRQQVREIKMLVKACRKGGLFYNRLEQFESNLRENNVEEDGIKLTLKFVDIFDSLKGEQKGQQVEKRMDSESQPNIQPKMEQDQIKLTDSLNPLDFLELSTKASKPRTDSSENKLMDGCNDDDENGMDNSQNSDTDEKSDKDDDPDYIKSEQEDEDYSSCDEDEDEEEMEIDSDLIESDADANDPLAELVKKALTDLPESSNETFPCDVGPCTMSFNKAILLDKHKFANHYAMIICEVDNCKRKLNNEMALLNHKWRCHPSELSEDEKNKTEQLSLKFPCSCGKSFRRKDFRSRHLNLIKGKIGTIIHPEYKRDEETKKYDKQRCDMCGEVVHFSKLLEHVRGHVGEDYLYRCPNPECLNIYTSSKMWQLHYRSSKVCNQICLERMSDLSLSCESCGVQMRNRYKLESHVKNEHEGRRGRDWKEKKWGCPISGCGEMFWVKQSVYFHLHVHRYREPIRRQLCDKCGGKFKVEEMEGHLKGEHGVEEVIGCGHCEKKFSGRDEMVEHLWYHKDMGFFCDICPGDKQGRFERYTEFRGHYFGEHKLCPKRYKCGEGDCEMLFWRRSEMDRHVVEKHGGEKEGRGGKIRKLEEFSCELCEDGNGSGRFKHVNSLIAHKIRVHGEDPFTCEVCGESFAWRKKLNEHKKEHAGVEFQKEWRCEVEGCGKILKGRMLWKRHVEVGHGGVKRHVCELCGKGYSDASGLKTHRDSVHLGLRPCVCDECGERFASSQILKRHKLIHTGERPFGCDICGQKFRHKEVLKRHLVGHEEKGVEFRPNGPMKQIRKRKLE